METQERTVKVFVRIAAILLLLTAGAKLYSATGAARILSFVDPLTHLRYRTLMLEMGLLESTVAAYLVFGSGNAPKLWLLFWLSSNFLMYRCASAYLHIHICPCMGTVSDALPLKRGEANFLLLIAVLWLFFGSAFSLMANLRQRPNGAQVGGSRVPGG